MECVELSKEMIFSRIIQGFWRLVEWNMTSEELVRFMEQCIDLGVTTFDTAEIYSNGECERLMGEAFRKAPYLRNKVQIVSKTGIFKTERNGKLMGYYDTRYEHIIRSCKESLSRLNCDYLDLYLIHREDPCIDHYEVGRAFQDLIAQGYVRGVGVSNFDPFKFDALQHATGHLLCTNQIEVNPLCFDHFNSGMMDLLVKEKIHPMIWSPLCGGRIFTSQEEYAMSLRKTLAEIAERHTVGIDSIVYAWLLYHPVKALPISGSRNIARLKNAVRGMEVHLTHNEWYEIYTASGYQVLR